MILANVDASLALCASAGALTRSGIMIALRRSFFTFMIFTVHLCIVGSLRITENKTNDNQGMTFHHG